MLVLDQAHIDRILADGGYEVADPRPASHEGVASATNDVSQHDARPDSASPSHDKRRRGRKPAIR